jgi:hypothetical protein
MSPPEASAFDCPIVVVVVEVVEVVDALEGVEVESAAYVATARRAAARAIIETRLGARNVCLMSRRLFVTMHGSYNTGRYRADKLQGAVSHCKASFNNAKNKILYN